MPLGIFFCVEEIKRDADERQHLATQTQNESLYPVKCVPCVGLSYSRRVQNMTENACFISPLYSSWGKKCRLLA